MEHEKNGEAEAPAEAPTEPESNMKEQEDNKNKSDHPVKSPMKRDYKKKETEASTGPASTKNKTLKSLKAELKIAKKPVGSKFLNSRKDKGGPQAQWKQRKNNKRVLKGNIESSNSGGEVKKLNSGEEGDEKNINNEEQKEKGHQPENNQEKKRIIELEKRKQKERNKERHGMSGCSTESQKNKEKHDGTKNGQHDEKNKEKLGGLIFMCNSKTKPDCFHYRVMGVTTSKKDVVLGIKHGIKLFLYDFDLKLLYGIYKAASSGGMKLEPRAFGGAFPVQVRFTIEKDCLPLPESVFKKAIKENYNEKHKFKTELTVKQARNLEKLFRPAEVCSTLLPVSSPQFARVGDRKVHERVREVLPCHHKETLARDPYMSGDSSRFQLPSYERDHQHLVYRDMATLPREETPRDLYPAIKDYGAYGPQGEHLPRQPDHLHINAISTQRETVHADPLYLNEREYHAYGLGARRKILSIIPFATATSATASGPYTKDPYHGYNYVASSSSYPIIGTHPIECSDLRRTETDRVVSLYSTDAADALVHKDRSHNYLAAQPEAEPVPVSSRYSFASLSFLHR